LKVKFTNLFREKNTTCSLFGSIWSY